MLDPNERVIRREKSCKILPYTSAIKKILTLVSLASCSALVVASVPAVASAAPARKYSNCAALNKQYRHGVAKSGGKDRVKGRTKPVRNFTVNTALYNANRGLDRDHDGVACEKL